jgi:Holliday junction resolvase RusA-like endonuclease
VHDYRKAIAIGAAAYPAMRGGISDQPLSVTIKLTFERPPSHRNKSGIKSTAPRLPKADVDNVAKAVLDAINGVAWHDDSQVAELIVRKSYGTAGATEVTIAELP